MRSLISDPCVAANGMPTLGCVWPECGAQPVDKPCPYFQGGCPHSEERADPAYLRWKFRRQRRRHLEDP